ncbi:MAG: sulfotransferase domain-containing protein [Alphaproteobacteria bacterium]|nr:sulfotransferase domain-containing protein [Alphaproteobacteria bacterium]
MFTKMRDIFFASPARDNEPTFVSVGYPKVGNTWLRVTLGRYLQSKYQLPTTPLMDIAEIGDLRSRGVKTTGNFTHQPLVWTEQTARELNYDNVVKPFSRQRVLLLCRHPLDTLVSLYMHQKYMDKNESYSGSVVDLIDDPVFGLEKYIQFYNVWHDNMERVKELKLWRFEDAKANPNKALTSVLRYLGETPEKADVDEAISFGSFENMRSLERGSNPLRYKSSGFAIFDTGDRQNPDAYHVRRGEVGGWRSEIPQTEHDRYIKRIRGELAPFFGYSD